MSNSARNGKKFGGSWLFSAVVPPPFLHSSLMNIIKAIAISNPTAVTLVLAEFLSFEEWFQKLAHPPPPPLIDFSTKAYIKS